MKDNADKSIEAIFLKPTKIHEFDEIFDSANAPLSKLVEMNNNFVSALENVKEASSIYQGGYKVVLTEKEKKFTFIIAMVNEDGTEKLLDEEELEEKLNGNEQLKSAYVVVKECVEDLNKSASVDREATSYELNGNRVKILNPGVQDDLLHNLNASVFTLRKELNFLSSRTGLGGALDCLKEEMKKVAGNALPVPGFKEDGSIFIMYGDGSESIAQVLEKLTPRAQILKKSFDVLESSSKDAATSVPDVAKQLANCAEKVAGFPEKAQGACTSSGLSGMDIIRAVKNTSYNVKAIGGGAQIAQQCLNTIKSAGDELQTCV